MVYFADENVLFCQLHHKSELGLPKDCFLTSWGMIWYILCLPNLLAYIATGIYVISMEDAKLQNLIVEPVFFFCALQSIRHCWKYTKFHFIHIQIKAYSGEKILSNAQKIVRTLEQKCRIKVFGCRSVDHCCSKRLLLRNKGQSTANTIGYWSNTHKLSCI